LTAFRTLNDSFSQNHVPPALRQGCADKTLNACRQAMFFIVLLYILGKKT